MVMWSTHGDDMGWLFNRPVGFGAQPGLTYGQNVDNTWCKNSLTSTRYPKRYPRSDHPPIKMTYSNCYFTSVFQRTLRTLISHHLPPSPTIKANELIGNPLRRRRRRWCCFLKRVASDLGWPNPLFNHPFSYGIHWFWSYRNGMLMHFWRCTSIFGLALSFFCWSKEV